MWWVGGMVGALNAESRDMCGCGNDEGRGKRWVLYIWTRDGKSRFEQGMRHQWKLFEHKHRRQRIGVHHLRSITPTPARPQHMQPALST